MSGGSVCWMRRSISRFFPLILIPLSNSTSSSNITPPRAFDASSIPSLHTIYAFLTGLLLTLIGIKYQGSGGNPFKEHPALMMLFLTAISVYAVALITFRPDQISDHSTTLMLIIVCHVSGIISCELLVLVLLSPIMWLVINASSIVLVVMLVLCYNYLLQFFRPQATESSETHSQQGQATEMVDLQAPKPQVSPAYSGFDRHACFVMYQ